MPCCGATFGRAVSSAAGHRPRRRGPAGIEVEPAGLAEPARLGRPALRAGLGGRRWLLRRGSRGAGRSADPHPADVAEVNGDRRVTGRAGRHPLLRLLSLPAAALGQQPRCPRPAGRYFLVLTVLVDLVSSAISSASSTFFFSCTVPVAGSITSTTLASSLAVSSLPDW